jgi:small subunit ribosomal protein S19
MVRVIMFKGKTPDDLGKLTLEEFSKLVKSRPRRAIKRMSNSFKELIEKADEMKKSGSKKAVRTATREAVIIPQWLGMTFAVYDGKKFNEFVIGPEHMGHRLGDFSHTVKHVAHSAPGIRATRGSKFLAVK